MFELGHLDMWHNLSTHNIILKVNYIQGQNKTDSTDNINTKL